MFSSRKTGSASNAYNLTKSLRFRSSAGAYLNRTPATTTNRKTWTWSGWVKRGTLGTNQSLFTCYFANNDTSYLTISFTSDNLNIGLWNTSILYTSAVYRDPSAWYHIVLAIDTTQATASNRAKLYVNGVQVTAFGSTGYPSQNTDLAVNSASAHYISTYDGTNYKFDGYQAEVNFIDGQALTPSSFGSTNSLTGVWQPAKYTGTYGTNGFYLPFTNTTSTTTLGYDFSGNSNNWTTNNLSLTTGSTYDSMTDVPTLTSSTTANYCVLNPLALGTTTLSNGNLNAVLSTTTSTTYSTLGMDSGKWYWEVTYVATTVNALAIGVNQLGNITTLGGSAGPLGTGGVGYYGFNGNKYVNGTGSAYGSIFTLNDVIGVALDVTGGTVTFYKNNTSQGLITLPTKTSAWNAVFDNGSGAGTQTIAVNFGQQPFTYTPPTGFVALNTYNLPTSTIVKGNTVMNATTYTGTGNGVSQTIINAGSAKPDLVWVKSRSGIADNVLFDSIRGFGGNKELASNNAQSEGQGDTASYGYVSSANSNGFTVTAGSVNAGYVNTNGATYVGWQWQAGQGSSSSNTSGSITSTVSVNATAGFSIVKWLGNGVTAATVGHGLGVVPAMIICKEIDGTDYWHVKHQSTASNTNLYLNTTNASTSAASVGDGILGDLSSSSTFGFATAGSPGNVVAVNENGINNIAYCWSEIAGFSKFGSYTGNGSSDGPFVYTGFRPKFVIIKISSTTGSWYILDTSINSYNEARQSLQANSSAAEVTDTNFLDILSNGFKLRTNGGAVNGSSATLIYMAFAENPFKNALAR